MEKVPIPYLYMHTLYIRKVFMYIYWMQNDISFDLIYTKYLCPYITHKLQSSVYFLAILFLVTNVTGVVLLDMLYLKNLFSPWQKYFK